MLYVFFIIKKYFIFNKIYRIDKKLIYYFFLIMRIVIDMIYILYVFVEVYVIKVMILDG